MPKLHFGSRGGVYYKKKGRKVYMPKNNFGNVFDDIGGNIYSKEVILPNLTDYMLTFPEFSNNLITLNEKGEEAIDRLLDPKKKHNITFLITQAINENHKGYCNHLLHILDNLQQDIEYLEGKYSNRLHNASREIINIIEELDDNGDCLKTYNKLFFPNDEDSPSMTFQERMNYLS